MVDFLMQQMEKVLMRRLGWWSAIVAQLLMVIIAGWLSLH
jgi:hypothetical protein